MQGSLCKCFQDPDAYAVYGGLIPMKHRGSFKILPGRRGTQEIWPSDPLWTTQIRSATNLNRYEIPTVRSEINAPHSSYPPSAQGGQIQNQWSTIALEANVQSLIVSVDNDPTVTLCQPPQLSRGGGVPGTRGGDGDELPPPALRRSYQRT